MHLLNFAPCELLSIIVILLLMKIIIKSIKKCGFSHSLQELPYTVTNTNITAFYFSLILTFAIF